MTKPPEKSKVVRKLRCAVYTRKSSEEGLEQEFNSLDAQREGPARALRLESDPTLERGDCVLESDVGTIDARIETRIAALARALEQR